jgi:hypothetical protein
MGEHHDAEGLIEILANGPYAAQLIAAHYLGRFGDKSAIDPLDVASQKWHPNAPSESNPFVDAIAAIEARAKEEQRQMELEAKKQKILEKTLPLIRSRLEKTEPNAPGTTSIAADANAISSEPNTFAAASSAAEPNQPAMDPHAAVPADANQLADSNSAM